MNNENNDNGEINWQQFIEPEVREAITRPKPKTKTTDMRRKRDGGDVTPEASEKAVMRNKTNNPVKTTLSLHTQRGIKGTRCLYRKDESGKEICYCYHSKTCKFKPSKSLPAQDRICPIPEYAYGERLGFYQNLKQYLEEFRGSAESASMHYAIIIWIEDVLIPTLGGLTALLLAQSETVIAELKKEWAKQNKDMQDDERKHGLTPESNFKLKLDMLTAKSLYDTIEEKRLANKEAGKKSLADKKSAWELDENSDNDIIEIEATDIVETKAPPEVPQIEAPKEPYTGNPFTGEASELYEKLKK